MGWCSGTDIFDSIVGDIIESNELSLKVKKKLIKKLAAALENQDWDCQCDSEYYNNPLVKAIFKELNPDWEDDEE